MIDLHNHLLPGVDDGSASLEQSREALAAYVAQGVGTVVVTPHFEASLLQRPAQAAAYLARLDQAWEALGELAAAEFPALRLARGVELMLDTPSPQLDDPRLRLAGSAVVLAEFPYMSVPLHAGTLLFELKLRGVTPLLAHPERYTGSGDLLRSAAEWKQRGALLQVNAGSVLGKYGAEPRAAAWQLLHAGLVDCIGSDYHARGTLHLAECRRALEAAGGAEQAQLLLEANPGRLLRGEGPLPVLALPRRRSFLKRILGGG